jgi:hypothetical protein
MKTRPFALINVLSILTITLSSHFAFADGERGGNGGTEVGALFGSIISQVLSYTHLMNNPANCQTAAQCELRTKYLNFVEKFGSLSNPISVEFLDQALGSDGKPRDAINNGIDYIGITRTRWIEMDFKQRLAILFHELSTIAGLEQSDDYSFSSKLYVSMYGEEFAAMAKKLLVETSILTGLSTTTIYPNEKVHEYLGKPAYHGINIEEGIYEKWAMVREICRSNGFRSVANYSFGQTIWTSIEARRGENATVPLYILTQEVGGISTATSSFVRWSGSKRRPLYHFAINPLYAVSCFN